MKPRQFQRGLNPKGNPTLGEAPKLGRVQRIRDLRGSPLLQRRRSDSAGRGGRTSDGSTPKRPALFAWSVLFAVTVVLVLGGMLVSWTLSRLSVESGRPAMAVDVAPDRPTRVPSPDSDEALHLVRSALKLRDPYQVQAFFRTGGSTPQEVVDFLGRLERREGKARRLFWRGNLDVEGVVIEGVSMVGEGESGKVRRWVFLVPDEHGNWRVDFEALAAACHPPWTDLCAHKADRAEVRVLIGSDSYFNGPYRDESQWRCYSLESPERDTRLVPEEHRKLVGYCPIGSPQALALDSVLAAGGTERRRATLEVRRAEGALDGQFEISRVISHEWVAGPQAVDERYR